MRNDVRRLSHLSKARYFVAIAAVMLCGGSLQSTAAAATMTGGSHPVATFSTVTPAVPATGTAALSRMASAPAADPAPAAVTPGTIAAAICGPGSSPENGVQGQVPLADRQSGRSRQGYHCNMSLVGQYQGGGASWVSAQYDHCAYLSSAFPGALTSAYPGVRVIDVADPSHPKLTAVLNSPAMAGGSWESLKVNDVRGLLGAVAGGSAVSVGSFDVYDVKTDCAHPKLLNSLASTALTVPANGLGHEGNWSPDGKTYWSAGVFAGSLTAIDVTDAARPHILWTGATNAMNHGFSFSSNGERLYMSNAAGGFYIFDVSAIQWRAIVPGIRSVSSLTWATGDGSATQHTIPFTKAGKPYLVVVDEGGSGAVKIVDISNETLPVIVQHMRLQIQLASSAALQTADNSGNELFEYEGHYCTLDRVTDPTTMACGEFASGVRVFDIRNLAAPHEVAYFNPPAQTGKNAVLVNSEHANGVATKGQVSTLTTDWCSSPPAFVNGQLWVTCQDNGFLALKFTNHAWPFKK